MMSSKALAIEPLSSTRKVLRIAIGVSLLVASTCVASPSRAEPARAPSPPTKKKPHDGHHKPEAGKPKQPFRPISAVPTTDALGPLPSAPEEPPTERFTLRNGLTVVIAPDRGDASSTVLLRFADGSSADPKAKGGTASLAAEALQHRGSDADAAVLSRGGAENVIVDRDAITFVIQVPPNELDLALYAQAERLASAAVESKALDRARSILSRPASADTFRDRLEALVFQGSPEYAHPRAGSAEERDGVSIGDLDDFVRAHIGSSNATLVLSGNIDPKAARERVDERFGSLPATGALSTEKVTIEEQTNQRTVEIINETSPSTLLYGWALPNGMDHENELEVAKALLVGEPFGRLNRGLAELGATAEVTIERRRGPGLFSLKVEIAKGGDMSSVRHVVESQLATLGKDLANRDELTLAKRVAWRGALEESRTPVGRAIALAGGGPALAKRRDAVESIDGPALRDTSAKLLGPLRRTVVVVRTNDATPEKHTNIHAPEAPKVGTAKDANVNATKRNDHKPPEAQPPAAHHPAKRKGAP